jgi:hypothetical protein
MIVIRNGKVKIWIISNILLNAEAGIIVWPGILVQNLLATAHLIVHTRFLNHLCL